MTGKEIVIAIIGCSLGAVCYVGLLRLVDKIARRWG